MIAAQIDADVMQLVRIGRRQAATGPTGRSMFADLLTRLREVRGAEQVDAALAAAGPRSWTLEDCKASASQFKTRWAWRKGTPRAYQAASYHRWLEQCCGHMPPPQRSWTLDECKASALRFTTPSAWQRDDSNTYQFARRRDWLKECCAHMKVARQSWTLEQCKASAAPFKIRKAWYASAAQAYKAAKRNRWLDQCCDHMRNDPSRKPKVTP